MTKVSKTRWRVSALTILVVILGGCGGGSAGSAPPPPPPAPVMVTISGTVNKGPFATGSDVVVRELLSNGSVAADLGSTKTIDSLAGFVLDIEREDVVLVEATGQFRNELDGAVSTDTVTLAAVHPVTIGSTDTLHVNVLTHLTAKRTMGLLQSGLAIGAASTQAQNELREALNNVVVGPDVPALSALSLFGNDADNEGNAYLLLVSTILYHYAVSIGAEQDLGAMLNTMADDLALDGVMDEGTTLADMRLLIPQIDPEQTMQVLADLATLTGSDLQVANINLFLDTDLDGSFNPADEDDDNDDVDDGEDLYPLDPTESADTDGDGIGDNADAFPLDPLETLDSDSDGVGDNADAFPFDELETLDSDSDGVGDNADVFPLDPLEFLDSDSDGIGNNGDADDDGDGVPDDDDAFPLDPACADEDDGIAMVEMCDATPTLEISHFDLIDNADMLYSLISHSVDGDKILRWSIEEERFWSAIDINQGAINDGRPTAFTYSANTNALYVGYKIGETAGAITKINLDGIPEETHVADTLGVVRHIAEAGDWLLLGTDSSVNTFGRILEIYDTNGLLTDVLNEPDGAFAYGSRWVWNAHLSRAYYARYSQIEYIDIDPATGQILTHGQADNAEGLQFWGPLKLSADGQALFASSGHVLDAQDFTVLSVHPRVFGYTQWTGDGDIIALFSGGHTLKSILQRRELDGNLEETLVYTGGQRMGLFPYGDSFVLPFRTDGIITAEFYTPSDDSDGDGVPNAEDFFATDPSASQDSDRDGHPDAWNSEMSASDSTDGLVLDAYPNDSACHLPEQGDGILCDIAAQIPSYEPDALIMSAGGVVHALSQANYRVYRWDATTGEYLNPLIVGSTGPVPAAVNSPLHMAYSTAHGRLYFGYEDGSITFMNEDGGIDEHDFAIVDETVRGLVSVGDYLLALDTADSEPVIHTIDIDGAIAETRGQPDWVSYQWDPAFDRLYYVQDQFVIDDIFYFAYEVRYLEIDQATGDMTSRSTHYSLETGDDRAAEWPLRLTKDGSKLLWLGEVYETENFQSVDWRSGDFTYGQWLADDGTVTLFVVDDKTVLERRGSNLGVVDVASYEGAPLALLSHTDNSVVAVTYTDQPHFFFYTLTDDSDSDGLPYTEDAFPLDPAASVDGDGDGYPDFWNTGMTATDSTTGLTLDAYPDDSACQLAEHGDGVVCDIASAIPDFRSATTLIDDEGVVYMLSTAGQAVYRWDTNTNKYLNPILLGSTAFLQSSVPASIALMPAHERLYIGYHSGEVTYIDLAADQAEHFFTQSRTSKGVVSAGNFLLVYSQFRMNVYAADGLVTGGPYEYTYHHQDFEWSAIADRLYFMSGSSLDRSHIDQASGDVQSIAGSVVVPEFDASGPVRVTGDGMKVLAGSGDVYDTQDLSWLGAPLPTKFEDAQWLEDGGTIVLRLVAGDTVLERRDASGLIVQRSQYIGRPVALLVGATEHLVVTEGSQPQITRYVFDDDSDDDGVPNLIDVFDLDPSASLDTDGDRFPDVWNAGMSAADSTTGLILDAYPNDPGCYLLEHGDAVDCDVTSLLPQEAPEFVEIDDNGVVYMLYPSFNRVYRWDTTGAQYLGPIVVGSADPLDTRQPTHMAYSPAHARLYFTYGSDANYVTYVDVDTASDLLEKELVELPYTPAEVLTAGAFTVLWNQGLGNDLVLDENGAIVSSFATSGEVQGSAWNEVLGHINFIRGQKLYYGEFDPLTGQFVPNDERISFYSEFEPIRVSGDGTRLLVRGGRVFDTQSPDLVYGLYYLPASYIDAQWTVNNHTVTLRSVGGNTLLERRNENAVIEEQRTYAGIPVAIRPRENDFVIVTFADDRPLVSIYTPSNDLDGDGIDNEFDALPNDPAASIDSDADGYPDAWNHGMTGADSTTGLVLDAYPNDTGCYLPEHGDGTLCDVASALPDYVPDRVEIDDSGIIYLLSIANSRIYRWNSATEEHLNPIIIGRRDILGQLIEEPRTIVYSSAHSRLYIGYSNFITYVDLDDTFLEKDFAAASSFSTGALTAAGNYLRNFYDLFDINGDVTYFGHFGNHGSIFAWDAANSDAYRLVNNQIVRTNINQLTGVVTPAGGASFTSSFTRSSRLRLSADGTKLMLASGDIHAIANLHRIGSLPPFFDGQWALDGGTVLLQDIGESTSLTRRDAAGAIHEVYDYPGAPIAIRIFQDSFIVVTDTGQPSFTVFMPNDDIDGDTIDNTVDAFASDPAASIDSDQDGFPDAWNPGMTAADSTTGLVLDTYPNDAACYLPEHGNGIACDVTSTLPSYVPDAVEIDENGVIYMLSSANARIYRWDTVSGAHLNPLVVGASRFTSDSTGPTVMAYSASHNRLYFGYEERMVTYVELGSNGFEQHHNTMAYPVESLVSAHDYILVRSRRFPTTGFRFYSFDASGGFNNSLREGFEGGEHFAWNPDESLLYFAPKQTQSDFSLMTLNVSSGNGYPWNPNQWPAEYDDLYPSTPPLRISNTGDRVLLGEGNIFNATTLEWVFGLSIPTVDAQWRSDGRLLTLREEGGSTTYEAWDESYTLLDSLSFNGAPLRVFHHSGKTTVMTEGTNGPQFNQFPD